MAGLDDALARVDRRRRLPPPPARLLLRQGAGLSQLDLAGELGVTRACIARWEAGERTPRPANLERYLALLDRLAQESLR